MTITRSTSSASSVVSPTGSSVIHKKRKIFKVNGSYFYISTGQNSVQGMAFPFYGVRKDGWFIKPHGFTNFFALRKEMEPLFQTLHLKEHVYNEMWNFLARFSFVSQMYTSYKIGHELWKSDIGVALSKYLDFDPSLYATVSVPSEGIEITEIAEVNKWLKTDCV